MAFSNYSDIGVIRTESLTDIMDTQMVPVYYADIGSKSTNITKTQSFIIHRHGARYPLKKPCHNILWPKEDKFWNAHIGRLTPVGVIQMSNLGNFFAERYKWADIHNVNVYSTHRSRALESAWSLLLGLLPTDSPIKFNYIKTNKCNGSTKNRSEVSIQSVSSSSNINKFNGVTCQKDVCCINYYRKNDDIIFGTEDPSLAYKININDSPLLKEYQDNKIIQHTSFWQVTPLNLLI